MPRVRLLRAALTPIAIAATLVLGAGSGGGSARTDPGAAPVPDTPAGVKPAEATSYGCPMHPEVRSPVPGACAICGMELLPMGAPLGANYEVRVETVPAPVRARASVRLKFFLGHPVSKERVTDLQIVHEKPFHLFIVGDDLETYQHLHPALGSDGAFEVDTELPRKGLYHLFSDFLPVGGTPQVIARELATSAYRPGARRRTRLTADTKLEKTVDGIRFHLALEPPEPAAGLPVALQYKLEDAATGAPVTDLEPYLGAWGHTLVLAEDATDFVHSHPTRLIPTGADRAALRGGPDVAFNARFAKPGLHRLWSQFQRGGRVTTVSFTIDVSPEARLASWDGKGWSSLDAGAPGRLGLEGAVHALAARGGELFAGGEFVRAGGVEAGRIARRDGSGWHPLGAGVNGTVRAIAVSGASVYIGGDFTEAGGVPAAHVARWDGSRWRPLAGGVSGCRDAFCAPTVDALVVGEDGSVYAGGRFARAGDVDAGGIARWNGRAWESLGGGVRMGERDGEVLALALGGGRLFAGGRFTHAGETGARSIAAWDGTRWLGLGEGVAGGLETVAALGFAGGVLYVGGDFTRAGGIDVARAARWDGASWSPLALRTREPVQEIAALGTEVVLGGGTFTLADGSTAKGVVRWDGAKWSALGPGVGGGAFLAPLQALALDGKGRLYVGGGPFVVKERLMR